MLTLWDLLKPLVTRRPPAPPKAPARSKPGPARPRRRADQHPATAELASPLTSPAAEARTAHSTSPAPGPRSAQARYDHVTRHMLEHYSIRVRKWRTSMSGIAWQVAYADGKVSRLIESPRPRGPMSAAVFLHEIGHHAIGFNVYKPRCLEEFHAWRWSLEQMQAHGLNITDAVRHRMHLSLWYAVEKARRRGLRAIPEELTPFLTRPPRRTKR